MSMHGLRNVGYANSCNTSTLDAIAAEVMRAREKFPGTRFLLAALVEEVGELGEALIRNDGAQIRREAVQVCAVAVRIIEEGDAAKYAPRGFHMLVTELGMVARSLLQRGNSFGALGSLSHWARQVAHYGDAATFGDITPAESKP